MPGRRPLTRISGITKELPASDTLIGNALFTSAASNLPTLVALTATTITITVTPKASGDSLQAGEIITVTPSAALPSGLNVGWAIVTDVNTVQIGLSALLAVTVAVSRSWQVAALR